MDDKRPEAPPLPAFSAQGVTENIDFLSLIGRQLSQGQFPDFLRDNVTLDNDTTQRAFNLATRDVERVRGNAQQSIINQLEANNQLTSSVAVNRLSQLNEEFSSDISDIGTNLYLADVNRALTNRMNLFGTGLNTINTATNQGQTLGARQSQFNQNQFDNQFAVNQYESQNSGFGGSIGGLIGGGIGAFVGGPVGFGIGSAVGGGIGEVFSPSYNNQQGASFVSGGLGFAQNSYQQQQNLLAQDKQLDKIIAMFGNTP